jgi:hypothetical protein
MVAAHTQYADDIGCGWVARMSTFRVLADDLKPAVSPRKGESLLRLEMVYLFLLGKIGYPLCDLDPFVLSCFK